MHVVATAGHVDHGKSTLVRALTGMEPDRWEEERRRGLTLDLGFAWTSLPSGEPIAFVDVPGHERFVANMLAGVGPVPAAMLVVAADEGWMPQSAEHLAALDALGVAHGLLVVTRCDLADPAPTLERARAQVRRTSLGDVEAVCVSGTTGEGLPALTAALQRLVAALPAPDRHAPVRLWVDRAFTVAGAGTVVTGTLGAGTLRTGDALVLARGDGPRLRVRGLQTLKQQTDEVGAVARVAVNLRGVPRGDVRRGDVLLTPDAWLTTTEVDARLPGVLAEDLPRQVVVHVGAAAVPARVRPLGDDTARLGLSRPLPLRVGDRAVVRDPGRRRVTGLVVLDVRPPALTRRGAAAARAHVLAAMDGRPDGADELCRRGLVRAADLRAMGAEPPVDPVVGDWLVDPEVLTRLRTRLGEETAAYAEAYPLEPGLPVEVARQRLDLPDLALVDVVASQAGTPPLVVREGRVARADARPALPPAVQSAVDALRRDLDAEPFAAPDATRLAELGLGSREAAAAVRVGALLRVGEGVLLLPDADTQAVRRLAGLPQPFTTSDARKALGTSRRVAIPLLEYLDKRGMTRRLPDDRREVTASS
ncbi:MAG: selenocysteine-specific translation elongation factor [Actinomycetes bacterium]